VFIWLIDVRDSEPGPLFTLQFEKAFLVENPAVLINKVQGAESFLAR